MALHSGSGVAIQIDTANQISIVNNTIFDFVKFGINVDRSDNVLIQNNRIVNLADTLKNEPPLILQQT